MDKSLFNNIEKRYLKPRIRNIELPKVEQEAVIEENESPKLIEIIKTDDNIKKILVSALDRVDNRELFKGFVDAIVNSVPYFKKLKKYNKDRYIIEDNYYSFRITLREKIEDKIIFYPFGDDRIINSNIKPGKIIINFTDSKLPNKNNGVAHCVLKGREDIYHIVIKYLYIDDIMIDISLLEMPISFYYDSKKN